MISGPAKGGSVTAKESPAKARALRRLHRSRRGVRVNTLGVTPKEWRRMLGDIGEVLNRRAQPGRVSRKAIARALKVSDRSVRRWLREIHWPTAKRVRMLARWLAEIQREQ